MGEANPEVARVLIAAGHEGGRAGLQPACEILNAFSVTWRETLASPDEVRSVDLAGIAAVIVASPDALLPGAFAAATKRPVMRVPVADGSLEGLALLQDSAKADLPSAEAPFATLAIGEAGAKNAALFVISILALDDPRLWAEWLAFRQRQTDAVLASPPLSTR